LFHIEQSRAVYAADVMLAWEGEEGAQKVQPKLLEINWMPDCQRACLYYPSFFDDIFSTLFLGQRKNVISL
jgi:tubulin--tyrosine ligase-like protein 12